MKKLFLLIPALALTLMANAVTPGTQALRSAYNDAEAGSTLVLEAGTYEETERIEFTKSMTIMAAEGAEVIVKTYKDNPLTLGAEVKFIGIKFDGSAMGTREYFIRSYDATAGNELHFENCEVYNFPSATYLINAASDARSLDSIIINNCYFHNNGNDAIFVNGAAASKGIIITNSTFANSSASHSIIEVHNAGTVAEDIELTVDHCTFYNNTFGDGDYSNIRAYKLAKSYISNCIFAHSEAYAKYAAYSYGGTISNCLNYNLTSGYRNWSPCAVFSNNITANPLFDDIANNKYTFVGNWVTMELSPARGAATDGSDLGDPRWYSAEVLPEVDFATPYQFVGPKALLVGQIGLNEADHIEYYDTEAKGTATWKIHATRACILNATLNMETGSSSGHKFKVAVLDADGNSVGELAEPSSTGSDGNINLPGTLNIPAVGDYTVILYNLTAWSSAKLEGVTFTYVGGDVQAMPGTTNISDAWFSEEGTRADGKIDFPDGHIQDGWVKWNVSFTDAANYNVTVNIDNANGHWYTVALYRSESDESPITVTEGKQMGTIGTLELGAMEVPAGNYILKVTNATQYSDAKLISVNFAYAGGAAVDLSKTTPASLLPNADAILSDDWTIEDGKIVHAESKALTGWAKWNVNSADDGNYNVTVNISSDNGHLVQVEIFEDENEPAIYTLNETATTQWHTGEMAIDLGNIALDNKEYVFKVSNTQSSSHVQIVSIVITYKNGAVQNIPGALTLTDAMLSAKAYIENDMLYFAPHDCGTIPEEWAKWNLHVADADVYQFAVNVTSPNGQKYTIIIEDKDGNEVYNLVQTSSLGSGDRSFTTDMMYLASGDYTLEMRNNYPYSDGHLVSISAAAVADVLTIDENATDNSVIYNNYRNGNHTIRLIRTIKAGMYNTICLPFDVSSSKLPAIFGSDVELKQMSSAELNGDELDLIFADATSIYRGTPYLIKTSSDVVNPIFTEVEIKAEVGDATSGTNADFIGNFIKSEVPAGENNLFLGPENLLYFSQTATPIKGMRAYFQLKGINHPQQVIKHARIVMNSQVATAIELVNGANNGSVKTIENGQLIIIRDGVRYNAMGAIIK